jgi:uroporphyrinogen-III synthase
MKLTILVTRPAHQAANLLKLIRESGNEPLLFPTIEITEPVDHSSFITAMQHLTDYDIAIFTSANAANKTLPHWPNRKPSLKIFAMGRGTTQALQQWGFKVDRMPKQNFGSEAILNLSELQNLSRKKIVIFTGEGGRTLLQTILTQRGGTVHTAFAYRRKIPYLAPKELAEWKKKHFDLIICTSNQSLENLITLLGIEESLLTTPLLVISERMRSFAQEQGFTHIMVAPEVSERAILDTLKLWHSKLRTGDG